MDVLLCIQRVADDGMRGPRRQRQKIEDVGLVLDGGLKKDDGVVVKESVSVIGESVREDGKKVMKVKEALNGLLAFDLITAEELWREILYFI